MVHTMDGSASLVHDLIALCVCVSLGPNIPSSCTGPSQGFNLQIDHYSQIEGDVRLEHDHGQVPNQHGFLGLELDSCLHVN